MLIFDQKGPTLDKLIMQKVEGEGEGACGMV